MLACRQVQLCHAHPHQALGVSATRYSRANPTQIMHLTWSTRESDAVYGSPAIVYLVAVHKMDYF